MKRISLLLTFIIFSLYMLNSEARDSTIQEIKVVSDNTIAVINTNGPVNVNSWNRSFVQVAAVKMTWSWDGNRELDEVHVDIDRSGNDITIRTRYGSVDPDSVTVMLEVMIPEDIPITQIKTYNGMIFCRGTRGDLTIEGTNSKIVIDDHLGDLDITSSNGRITIEYLQGDGRVSASNAAVTALDVTGNFSVETTNGDIYLEGASGTMVLATNKGNISVENLHGSVDAVTSTGSITIQDIDGNVKSKTNSGNIRMMDIDGYVSAWCENGTVSINNIHGIQHVFNKNGTIRVDVENIPKDGAIIEAGNGTIIAAISPDLDLAAYVNSERGRVVIDGFRKVKQVGDTGYEIQIGDGTRKLTINADNGNIIITSL